MSAGSLDDITITVSLINDNKQAKMKDMGCEVHLYYYVILHVVRACVCVCGLCVCVCVCVCVSCKQ